MPIPDEAKARAFNIGDPVIYCNAVHHVKRRTYRQSTGEILYDLREDVRKGAIPRWASNVPEEFVHKPTLHSLKAIEADRRKTG